MNMLYRIFILTACIACFQTAHAQLTKVKTYPTVTIGEVNNMVKFIAKLYYTVGKTDTTYVIEFNDMRYGTTTTSIKSFSFKNEHGALDSLYNMLSAALNQPSEQPTLLKLGNEDISFSAKKAYGSSTVTIYFQSAYFTLNRKQLNKLFNKQG
jgi:hypothetical protein